MSLSMVPNVVVKSILLSLEDVLGRDGAKSVLIYGQLGKLAITLTETHGCTEFHDFVALLTALWDIVGVGSGSILYETGARFALILFHGGGGDPVRHIMQLQTALGGVWSVRSQGTTYFVKVQGCSFCKLQVNESKLPMCYILAGGLAKLYEEATGQPYDGREIQCEACGNECCEFELTRKR